MTGPQPEDVATADSSPAAEHAHRFAALIESTSDFVCIADGEGRALYLNPALRELVGLDRDADPENITLGEIHPRWAAELVLGRGVPAAVLEGTWSGETALLSARGEEIPTSEIVLVHKTPDGAVDFISTIARDMSERKTLEARLRQAQKMEAIGQLAGGVAHDFNNILSVIQNYARFLLETEQDETRKQDIKEIELAGGRAATLIRQLLTFSRREITDPQVIDINRIVSELQQLLTRTLRADVRLEVDLHDGLWSTRIDPGQLEQIVMNLTLNSRDALPDGGRISIETFNQVVDEGMAKRHEGLYPGDYATLHVHDNGQGMSPDLTARVFEPFFTTKPRSEGTGLGLASVYGIVKQAGGYVRIESAPGVGTSVYVYLPAVAQEPEPPRREFRRESLSGKGETVLVAEDEPAVREVVRRILERNGYRVMEAASGEEALDLVHKESGGVDVLLTDVVMPGISGKDLADALRERFSDVPTVYMSGYTDQIIARHGLLEKGNDYIQKPFDEQTLLVKLRNALNPADA